MTKQLVVVLLELDAGVLKESGLTQKQFEQMPATLAKEIKKLAPKAIHPTGVYFLTNKEKARLEQVLESRAMDFTEVVLSYAGQGHGAETCTVIKLDSHRRKQHPGTNRN